jgi:uridine phosphorylase
MGQHTAASILYESGEWRKVPLLEANEGKLPPNLIVVGDRRRADTPTESITSAANHLSTYVDLSAEAQRLCGNKGRVNILVGFYKDHGSDIPVTIFETQMAMGAQDITLQEALCLCDPRGYNVADKRLSANEITVIRVGSCGGINSDSTDKAIPPVIMIGDLVIGESSFGHSGVIRQRLSGLDYDHPKARGLFERRWNEMKLKKQGNFLCVDSDLVVVAALLASARALGHRAHLGNNFSKETLYCEESDVADFLALRQIYKAMSTEMEHLGIGFLARYFTLHGVPVRHGLISAVVGALPEQSFPRNEAERQQAAGAESAAMKTALDALWLLSIAANSD